MDRNFIYLIAILLLVPSAFLGLMPYLAAHTSLIDNLPKFTLEIFGVTLASYHKDLNGDPVVQSSWVVWGIAVIAEIGLLAAVILKDNPVERARKLTHRG